MPRFVILTHDHPFLHWDFMLEQADGLRTWRLLQPADTPGPISAEASFLHRSIYLDYEGPVSNHRGTVQRWDRGVFEWVHDSPEAIEVVLHGQRVHGRVRLASTIAGWRWSLVHASETSTTGGVE